MTTEAIRKAERTTEADPGPIPVSAREALRGDGNAAAASARAQRIDMLKHHADPQIDEEIQPLTANREDARSEPGAGRGVLVIRRILARERAHAAKTSMIQLQAQRERRFPSNVRAKRVARTPVLLLRSIIEARTEPRVEAQARFERER